MSRSHDHQGCRRPHKDALFLLIPENEKAEDVVESEDNAHLVSFSSGNIKCFDIGFHISSQHSPKTLVTLGRDNCDILLKPQSLSKLHCSFEIDDLDTGIVMLYDRSHSLGTHVSGTDKQQPFQVGRSPRKVLVHPDLNDIISMGGKKGDLIKFRLDWIMDEDQIKRVARTHRIASKGLITNPRKARTHDPTDTILPSAHMTPDEAFIKPSQLALRYFKRDFLGSGSYGRVWRVIGVDTGRVMAMKEFQSVGERHHVAKVYREVNLMRLAKHPNIADLITSQGWGDRYSSIKIFMGLEEGSVDDLSNAGRFTLRSGLPERCLEQMLLALKFLAFQGIVHRDVKPDNILYSQSRERSGYDFKLADFGVGKLEKYAYSLQGTNWFMAPEILELRNDTNANSKTNDQQSPKVDVWSLFVAIAYARDVCNYRERKLNTNDQILTAVREAREERWMSKYSAMVIEKPHDRASAHDILVEHFNESMGSEVYDVRMSAEDDDDDDGMPLDLQPAQAIHHPPLVLKPRQSPLPGHPNRIEKRKLPRYTRTPLAQTSWKLLHTD